MYGASTPADACVAPMPTARSSTTSTDAPRRASSYAMAHPMTPAPTTMMSRFTKRSYILHVPSIDLAGWRFGGLVNSNHQVANSPIHQLQTMSGDVTQLLAQWSEGDRAALDALMPVVYGELRKIADAYLRRERSGHTLQPTALVHEAWMRLVRQDQTRF